MSFTTSWVCLTNPQKNTKPHNRFPSSDEFPQKMIENAQKIHLHGSQKTREFFMAPAIPLAISDQKMPWPETPPGVPPGESDHPPSPAWDPGEATADASGCHSDHPRLAALEHVDGQD